MVRPAAIDPPVIQHRLWAGFTGDRAFDVGTNCGQTIGLLLERFRAVTGFEPCRDSWELARAAHPGVEIVNMAVSDRDGTVTLALIEGEQADTGQLVSPGTHGMEWDPGDWEDRRVRKVEVQCVTLDALAARYGSPDFVKIDTEGHERRVLCGGLGLLTARRTRWLVEFHSPEQYRLCKQLLESTGHEAETVRHPHYPPGSEMYYQHGWIRAWPRG